MKSGIRLQTILITLMVFGILHLSVPLVSQEIWQEKDNMPLATAYGVSFVINDFAYVGLGLPAVGASFRNDFYKYYPGTDTWVRMADYPGNGLYDATAFSINGKGYICLGYSNDLECQRELWEYDPISDTYVRKADFPGIGRYGAFGFVVGGKAYVGGGSYNNGFDYLCDLYCYDPVLDIWTQKADFQGGSRYRASSFVIGNYAYVGGGASNTNTHATDFWRYDFMANNWSQIENIPDDNHDNAVTFTVNNQGYLGTGFNIYNQTYHATFFRYSPETGNWSGLIVPPTNCTPRHSGVGFSINGVGYFGVGFASTGALSSFWSFTPCNSPIAGYSYSIQEPFVNFFDYSDFSDEHYWNFGDGYFSNVKNPQHSYESHGKYRVCHTVSNDCGTSQFCDTVNFCKPLSTFYTYSVNEHFVTFKDSAFEASLWNWDFGDGFYSNLANPVHYFNDFGTYWVCLYASNECNTESYCDSIRVLPNGLPQYKSENYRLVSNPVRSELIFYQDMLNKRPLQIEIFNMTGETVFQQKVQYPFPKVTVQLPTIQGGVYFLLLSHDGIVVFRHKFLKIQ